MLNKFVKRTQYILGAFLILFYFVFLYILEAFGGLSSRFEKKNLPVLGNGGRQQELFENF